MTRLDGPWQLRVADDSGWRPAVVPGCWEYAGIAKDFPGPVEYRTTLQVPAGQRAVLRFGAVSFACVVLVDGVEVGRHIGMWDPFEIEIVGVGRSELLVRVEKPASRTAGPDSPVVPGNYPVSETLSGFLPYVWGQVHGGIWQDVDLVLRGPVGITDVHARGSADGVIQVDAGLTAPGRVVLTVHDPDGSQVAEEVADGAESVEFAVRISDPRPWSPGHPDLYTVVLRTDDDEATARIGLRTITVDGPRIRLGDEPLYPRMILSWGWYPDVLHCDPGPERVRADLLELKGLGFNGVKLCLWFPPQYYFDIADELGMLLWVELPMWLPSPTERFRRQLFAETERLVRAGRNHPSVILWTLGCELGAAIGDDLLAPLYRQVKEMVGDALVRDNSGSGEAYGGLLAEHADFYDHHFYCELPEFRRVLDYFAPQWRAEKPWLFGEFCDLDTFRDLRTLTDHPWWTSADPAVNPQGARWQYDVGFLEERLRANGFWDRSAELARISHRQAVLHRKVTLEIVRSRADTSGYVITGERDTPISTAGVWDDLGRLKVDPAEFAQFNGDLVLTLGWDRRRAWVAGGDRPAYWDTWCHETGTTVRPHIVLAHHGVRSGEAVLRWEIGLDGESAFAGGGTETGAAAETVRELSVAEFVVPEVDRPRRATLRATCRVGSETTSNTWSLWFFPRFEWDPVRVVDPAGRLAGLPTVDDPDAVLVATAWTDEVRDRVHAGGRAVVLLAGPSEQSPCPVREMPFWREAVKLIEPHEAWGDFPHDGWVDLQFAGCAADSALDVAWLPVRPLLRRVDARTGAVHDYATEFAWGAGRVIASTLRIDGGLGDQPVGITRNTGAAYLLSRWARAL